MSILDRARPAGRHPAAEPERAPAQRPGNPDQAQADASGVPLVPETVAVLRAFSRWSSHGAFPKWKPQTYVLAPGESVQIADRYYGARRILIWQDGSNNAAANPVYLGAGVIPGQPGAQRSGVIVVPPPPAMLPEMTHGAELHAWCAAASILYVSIEYGE